MVGPEGVEMSSCCPALLTEVSQLMDVECMTARLQTGESPTETEPTLSTEQEIKIFPQNLHC